MTKEQAIEQLTLIKRDLDQMEKFAGQAKAKSDIEKKIAFLMKYKTNGNLPELFVKEAKKLNLPKNK